MFLSMVSYCMMFYRNRANSECVLRATVKQFTETMVYFRTRDKNPKVCFPSWTRICTDVNAGSQFCCANLFPLAASSMGGALRGWMREVLGASCYS